MEDTSRKLDWSLWLGAAVWASWWLAASAQSWGLYRSPHRAFATERGPLWAAAGWFVPIFDLVMLYQLVKDLAQLVSDRPAEIARSWWIAFFVSVPAPFFGPTAAAGAWVFRIGAMVAFAYLAWVAVSRQRDNERAGIRTALLPHDVWHAGWRNPEDTATLREWFWNVSAPQYATLDGPIERLQHLRRVTLSLEQIEVIVRDRDATTADAIITSLVADLRDLVWSADEQIPLAARYFALSAAATPCRTVLRGRQANSEPLFSYWDTLAGGDRHSRFAEEVRVGLSRRVAGLLTVPDAGVQLAVIRGLGRAGGPRAVARIQRFIGESEDDELVAFARRTLEGVTSWANPPETRP